MLHKLLKNIIIGLLIGLSTSYIVLSFVLYADGNSTITGASLLEQVLISAVMGMVIGIAMLVYETKLMFTVQLIIHFIIVTAIVFGAGLIGEWFSLSEWQSLIKVFLIELVAYTIIWFIVWVLMKKEVDEINDLIQQRKKG